MILSWVRFLIALNVVFSFAFAQGNDDLQKLKKKQAEIAAQQEALAAQIEAAEEADSLDIPLADKAKILRAFREHMLTEAGLQLGTDEEIWQETERGLKDAWVMMRKSQENKDHYELYFAHKPKGQKGTYEGYGLDRSNGEFFVYVDYDNIEIGAAFIPDQLFSWVTQARLAHLEKQYSDAHPRLRDSVLGRERNQLSTDGAKFTTSLERARDKEAAAKVRFLEKIIRNGVPYSWLLKEINESCDGILAPGK